MRKIIQSFNAGELSPWLDSRVDLEKHASGCRTLRNFLLTPYGGIRKRAGTKFMGDNGTAKTRLLRFAYSVGTNYILELSANLLRFWDAGTGALVQADGGGPLAIATPWTEAQIFEVRISQINDVAFLTHPAHAPRKLVRASATSWTLNEIGFDADNWPPFRDENTNSTTIAATLSLGPAGIVWKYGPRASLTRQQIYDAYQAGTITPTATGTSTSRPQLGMYGSEAATEFYYYVETYVSTADTGTHTFYSTANAAVTLWVNGTQVLTTTTSGAEASGSISLLAGLHKVVIVYVFASTGSKSWTASTGFMWDPPSTGKVAVPTANLYQTRTDAATLVANADIFEAGHVGAYFMLAHDTDRAVLKMTLTSSPTLTPSGDFVALGEWSMETRGIWSGVLKLQRTYDGTNWETIRTWEGHKGNMNFTGSGIQSRPAKFRFQFTDDSGHTASADPAAILTLSDSRQYSIVRITAVTDAQNATADIVRGLYASGTATSQWFEGAWSTLRGYPRTVTLHEQRAIYAGNAAEPGTLWASGLDDFENFRQGTTDADAWTYSIASPEQNAIQWIASQTQLMIGTSAGEWVIRASENGAIITPTSVRVTRQSNFGADYLPSIVAGDAVIFFQRGGRTVREFAYQFERDGWAASNLTLLAEHVTDGGIVQTAWQQQRDGILYCVTGDGKLAALTYERDQAVIGWHVHETAGGNFESVAIVYGTGEEDEVWLVVNRDGTRCIERLETDSFRRMEEEDSTLAYLDGYVTATSTPSGAVHLVTGLDHLEGLTVTAQQTGFPTATVTGGEAEFSVAIAAKPVGVAIASEVRPMPMEAQLQDGTAQGRTKRVIRMALRLRKSKGGKFGTSVSNQMDAIPYDDANAFTGEREVFPDGGFDQTGEIRITHATPEPFQILALIPKVEINGP